MLNWENKGKGLYFATLWNMGSSWMNIYMWEKHAWDLISFWMYLDEREEFQPQIRYFVIFPFLKRKKEKRLLVLISCGPLVISVSIARVAWFRKITKFDVAGMLIKRLIFSTPTKFTCYFRKYIPSRVKYYIGILKVFFFSSQIRLNY